MKNWITFAAITVSFAITAQHGNGNNDRGEKKEKPGVKTQPGGNKDQKHSEGNKGSIFNGEKIKQEEHGGSKMPKQKGNPDNGHDKSMYKSKFHFEKGHVNHIYMYEYTPFNYPTKNYGQWRSQQARNKHKSYPVVLELNVLNGIAMIQERNKFVLLEIDLKIDRYNTLVIERHKLGLITDVQLSFHLENVKKMKNQRGRYKY